jgi:hypothetical protein
LLADFKVRHRLESHLFVSFETMPKEAFIHTGNKSLRAATDGNEGTTNPVLERPNDGKILRDGDTQRPFGASRQLFPRMFPEDHQEFGLQAAVLEPLSSASIGDTATLPHGWPYEGWENSDMEWQPFEEDRLWSQSDLPRDQGHSCLQAEILAPPVTAVDNEDATTPSLELNDETPWENDDQLMDSRKLPIDDEIWELFTNQDHEDSVL